MIITPEPKNVKLVAQMLLQLAASPYEVATVSAPGTAFRVSDELYVQFVAAMEWLEKRVAEEFPEVDAEAESDDEADVEAEVEQEQEPGAPKRRGRPRKKEVE